MPLIKPTLEQQLYQAAYNAFLDSFLDATPEDGDERNRQADAFAKKFSNIAATAIDTYIKSATIMGGIVNTAGGPTAQVGSVTGPLTIS